MQFSIDQRNKKDSTSISVFDDGPGFAWIAIDDTTLGEDLHADICLTPDEARAFAKGILLIADEAEKRQLIKRTGKAY